MASGIAHEHLPDVKVPEVEGEAKDDLCEVPGELHTSSGQVGVQPDQAF